MYLAVALLVSSGGAGAVYAFNYYDEHEDQIARLYHSTATSGSTVIYDRNGNVLYTARSDNGFNYYRPRSQINKQVIQATIDTEDRSFYDPTNVGVDIQWTLRALTVDLAASGDAEFGSDNPLAFPDHPGIEIAAKTGTAAGVGGPSDTVTVGYSPYLALGVWVGNTPGSDDMGPGIIGISGSGYIFHDVMEWAIEHFHWPAVSRFPVPPDLARGTFNCATGLAPFKNQTSYVCAPNNFVSGSTNLYSGYQNGGNQYTNTDWYIQGQEPDLS